MSGKITCYVGPMKSGKSRELIRKYKSLPNKNRIVASCLDKNKDTPIYLMSRYFPKTRIECTENFKDTISLRECLQQIPEGTSLFIDELQFIEVISSMSITNIIEIIRKKNINIYASALTGDFRGDPWMIVNYLYLHSGGGRNNHVEMIQLVANCEFCMSKNATHTTKIGGTDNRVELKDVVEYKAACFSCWRKHLNCSY